MTMMLRHFPEWTMPRIIYLVKYLRSYLRHYKVFRIGLKNNKFKHGVAISPYLQTIPTYCLKYEGHYFGQIGQSYLVRSRSCNLCAL